MGGVRIRSSWEKVCSLEAPAEARPAPLPCGPSPAPPPLRPRKWPLHGVLALCCHQLHHCPSRCRNTTLDVP